MSTLESLEQAIQQLPADELAQFRAWFIEYDWENWDQQIGDDLKSGKLGALIAEARVKYDAGKAKEI